MKKYGNYEMPVSGIQTVAKIANTDLVICFNSEERAVYSSKRESGPTFKNEA